MEEIVLLLTLILGGLCHWSLVLSAVATNTTS